MQGEDARGRCKVKSQGVIASAIRHVSMLALKFSVDAQRLQTGCEDANRL